MRLPLQLLATDTVPLGAPSGFATASEAASPLVGFALRPWRAGDEDVLASLASDVELSTFMIERFPYPFTHTSALAWVVNQCQQAARPCLDFAIVSQSDEVVGSISLTPQDGVYKFSLGCKFWLGRPHWGKGIATAAVLTILKYVRDVLNNQEHDLRINRVFATTYKEDQASVKVLQKAGFQFEGTRRAAIHSEGTFHDELLYARILDEQSMGCRMQ